MPKTAMVPFLIIGRQSDYAEYEWLRFLKLVGHIAVKFDAEGVGSNSVSI